ncbi:MAG: protoheme IX farnesyltransferase [Bacteroidales bacterium]|nr:protoheme IX farnesyltransferase [Bacteroidales bacterium]
MNKRSLQDWLTTLFQLGKIKISIPVALTGFLGYYRASGDFSEVFFYTIFGILFMAMGSSTFNQIQERRTDMLMQRTEGRPLPSGRISLKAAIIVGIAFSIAGLFLLLLTGSLLAASIGIFTLSWYNLVYTPLKKITPFAVFPGAVIGALPPLIGWTAAGGSITDYEIILISLFLFIGQMPHYWLLLMKVSDQFKQAGLPVITDLFSKTQLRNISFIWIFAAAIAVTIFPVSGIMHSSVVSFVMIAGALFFLFRMYLLSFRGEIMVKWKQAFVTENLFYLFIILILIVDKFLEGYLYM